MEKTFNTILVALMIISCLHVSQSQTGLDDVDPNGPFAALPSIPTPQDQNQQQAGQDQQLLDALGSTTTAASATYLSCFNGCPTVTNYNPVCGSDGVTYTNEGKLNCANRCGRPVTMTRGGTCVGL